MAWCVSDLDNLFCELDYSIKVKDLRVTETIILTTVKTTKYGLSRYGLSLS